MSQNDLVIANQSFPATRADINSALQALGSLNSGSSAPATTYANMLWYDTTNNILKMRAEANDQWISIGYLDQTADAFRIFDDTQVVNSSGTQTGLIGDQATSAWEAGTSTTESLVSPAKVKAAIDELADVTAFAEGAAGQPRLRGEAVARAADLPVLTVTATTAYDASNCFEETTPLSGETRRLITRACTGSVIFTIRASVFDEEGSGSSTTTSRLYKNGTQVLAVSSSATDGSNSTSTSGSVSVVPTDVITLQVTATTFGGSGSGSIDSITASDGYVAVPPLVRASTL